jgi:hypothetical protein
LCGAIVNNNSGNKINDIILAIFTSMSLQMIKSEKRGWKWVEGALEGSLRVLKESSKISRSLSQLLNDNYHISNSATNTNSAQDENEASEFQRELLLRLFAFIKPLSLMVTFWH